MPRNSLRIGAGIVLASSIMLIAACTTPKAMLTAPSAPSAPASATVLAPSNVMVSQSSTLEDGSTLSGNTDVTASGSVDTSNKLNVTIHCTPKVYDSNAGAIRTEVTLTNNGPDLDHVIVVVDGVSPSTISLDNADGTLNGKSYVYVGHLAAGETSRAHAWLWKSDSLVHYECVTHVEAVPSCIGTVINSQDLDDFFASLNISSDLKVKLRQDFDTILRTDLTLAERFEACKTFRLDLNSVSDASLETKIRLKFRDCFYSGLVLDEDLNAVTEADLKARLHEDLWECLHVQTIDYDSLKVRLADYFDGDLALVTDLDLRAKIEARINEVLSFCDDLDSVKFDADPVF